MAVASKSVMSDRLSRVIYLSNSKKHYGIGFKLKAQCKLESPVTPVERESASDSSCCLMREWRLPINNTTGDSGEYLVKTLWTQQIHSYKGSASRTR